MIIKMKDIDTAITAFQMKEFELPTSTCMGGWYMPSELCDNMVNVFEENSKYHGRGNIRKDDEWKVDIDEKDSYDMSFNSDLLILPFKNYTDHLDICLQKYVMKYEYINRLRRFEIVEKYNIQKYLPKGGFKKWHFEDNGSKKRVLVFMTYLNDLSDEGGTEFLYQNLKIKPQKGLTLIWPAGWTHTHRGIISKTQTKYIATGWYSFIE